MKFWALIVVIQLQLLFVESWRKETQSQNDEVLAGEQKPEHGHEAKRWSKGKMTIEMWDLLYILVRSGHLPMRIVHRMQALQSTPWYFLSNAFHFQDSFTK